MEPAKDILQALLPESCESLFADYGVELQPSTEHQPMRMMSVIGFSAREMHGSLALAASESVVRASLPFADGCPNDWLGELANQLLGRLKNRLYKYGLELDMAVPMVLRGLELQVHGEEHGRVMRFEYASPTGPICIWMDVDFDEHLMLEEQEQEASAEGAVLFF